MRALLLNGIALVVAAGLCALGAVYAAKWVEAQSLAEVDAALDRDGQEWVEPEADGLRVILSGTAPDEPARFRALTVAASVIDGARLIDAMQVAPPEEVVAPDFRVEILRSGDDISLIGLLPDEAERDLLRDRIRRAAGSAKIVDLLETADGRPAETWNAAFEFGLDAFSALPRAKISITADRVSVAALVDDVEEKRQVEATLSRGAPAGVALDLAIAAPRPVIAPFSVRFLIDDEGARFDTCAAGAEAGLAEILRAAVAAGLEPGAEGAPDCILGLGAPSPRWGEAVAAGIATLSELGGGSLTFADGDVTIVALQGTDPETFDAAIGSLEAALPPAFALHAILPAPPEAPEASDGEGPARFVAIRRPEGMVELRGRLTDDRARSIVEGFAQARFGAADTELAVRLDEDAPEGWTLRVLAGLDALGFLSNGAVTVMPDNLLVRGRTGSREARGEITRLLSTRLGTGEEYSIEIEYDEALDPEAGLPTPRECLAQIKAAAAERKINFAPGSADIDEESRQTLDRIAEILRGCPPVEIEIAGYTDSQGREEMNLSLSQSRAETVLNELMSRRVLTSGFEAQGFGEADPIADNTTEAGREANRRIEFRLVERAEETAEGQVGPR